MYESDVNKIHIRAAHLSSDSIDSWSKRENFKELKKDIKAARKILDNAERMLDEVKK